MGSIGKVRSISVWIFIIPFISVNTCLLIVTNFHQILEPGIPINPTFPYFDGGVSISRTVRDFPLYLIFKPAMFITSYLLIGSDQRDSEAEDSYIKGQRADVIILGLFNETINKNALISIPRDTLVNNLCTGETERINASYNRNNCGNGAENIVAAVNNLTGLKIEQRIFLR